MTQNMSEVSYVDMSHKKIGSNNDKEDCKLVRKNWTIRHIVYFVVMRLHSIQFALNFFRVTGDSSTLRIILVFQLNLLMQGELFNQL